MASCLRGTLRLAAETPAVQPILQATSATQAAWSMAWFWSAVATARSYSPWGLLIFSQYQMLVAYLHAIWADMRGGVEDQYHQLVARFALETWHLVAIIAMTLTTLMLICLVAVFRKELWNYCHATAGGMFSKKLKALGVRRTVRAKLLTSTLLETVAQVVERTGEVGIDREDWCHVKCSYCTTALQEILGGRYGKIAADTWRKHGEIPHDCIFTGGKDYLALAAAVGAFQITAYWLLVHDSKGTEPQATPEAPNVNKPKQKAKYAFMRSKADRAEVKPRMSQEEYEWVVSQVEAGNLQYAEDEAQEALYVEPHEEILEEIWENDADVDGGMDRGGGGAHRCIAALRNRNNAAAGARARVIVQVIDKRLRSKRGPEGPPGKVQPFHGPEAPISMADIAMPPPHRVPQVHPQDNVLINADDFRYVSFPDVPEAMDAYAAICAANEANHHAVVNARVTAKDVAEAALTQLKEDYNQRPTDLLLNTNLVHRTGYTDTPIQVVVPPKETVQGKKKKLRKGKGQSAQARMLVNAAAVLPQPTPPNAQQTPESTTRGNALLNFAQLGVRAITLGPGHGGVTLNGVLFRGPNNTQCFATCRHEVVRKGHSKGVVDRFASGIIPTTVVMHSPARFEDTVVEVKGLRANGDDRVVFILEGAPMPTKNPKLTTAAEYMSTPGTDKLVSIASYIAGEWLYSSGPLARVNDDGTFHYFSSTMDGSCRSPVFTNTGHLMGGHYHPGITIGGNNAPGAEPENLTVPPTFVQKYDPPHLLQLLANPQTEATHKLPVVGYLPGGREEQRKIHPLKMGVSTQGVNPKWVYAKPSTKMLHKEVHRFAEPAPLRVPKHVFDKACTLANTLESAAHHAVPDLQGPRGLERFRVVVRLLGAKTGTSTGSTGDGATHHDYVVDKGNGDFETGVHVVAQEIWNLYDWLCDHGPNERPHDEDPICDAYDDCMLWAVQGKKDGYAHAGEHPKVDVGRSIQAPSFQMKVMWKAVMEPADDVWNKRDGMCRTGYDFARAVPKAHAAEYFKAKAVLAFDETAFDRYVPREMIHAFFFRYIPVINPGTNSNWLQFICSCTCDSLLQMTDGTVYIKDHGNPSGFMNTLRLNCYIQLLIWCCIMIMRAEQLGESTDTAVLAPMFTAPDLGNYGDFFLEICGDDSRIFLHNEVALRWFDMEGTDPQQWGAAILELWKEHFPWVVKIEGAVVLDWSLPTRERIAQIPPFIGRQVVVVHNLLWTPLVQPSRTLKRLMHVEDLSIEMRNALVVSSYATLALQVYWTWCGELVCPAMEFLRKAEEDLLVRCPLADPNELTNMVRRMMFRLYTEAAQKSIRVSVLEELFPPS